MRFFLRNLNLSIPIWFYIFALVFPCLLHGAVQQWQPLGEHRIKKIELPAGNRLGFTQMPPETTGVQFTNELSLQRWVTNQIYLSGSGVAAGDVNGDGWTDLYFCGIDSSNELYLNRGNWKFEAVARGTPLECKGAASSSCVFADMDGDGDVDLLVGGYGHGVRYFANNGSGAFVEKTDEAGLRSMAAVTTLALGDLDGDGDLDLYAATYGLSSLSDEPPRQFRLTRLNNRLVVAARDGKPLTREQSRRYHVDQRSGEIVDLGDPDLLYRNEGGKFVQVPWGSAAFLDQAGNPMQAPLDWSLTAMIRDMNGDGWPDLYVCNDHQSPELVMTNTGTGSLRAIQPHVMGHTSLASMGVDFADINRDGLDDFFVVDMLSPDERRRLSQLPPKHGLHVPGGQGGPFQYLRNTLFLNRGDGTYSEIAHLAGLEASDWSWMPLFMDADLDGWEDVFITTGIERNFRHAEFRKELEQLGRDPNLTREGFFAGRQRLPSMRNPNYAFRNNGNLTFSDVSGDWNFNSPQLSHGMCMADLDNDGDSDLIVNCMNSPALLYRNETSRPRVLVRLKGASPNTGGAGAQIKVLADKSWLQQEVMIGGRYLSSDEGSRSFAALSNRVTVKVRWRNGRQTMVEGVAANSIIEVSEKGSLPLSPEKPKEMNAPLFAKSDAVKGITHFEEFFNDFDRQPLIPRLYSQQGPGIAWGDLNRDGWDDLVIGQGQGGFLGFLLNNTKGGFQPLPIGEDLGPLPGDAAGVLILPVGTKGAEVIAGMANYEGDTNSPALANMLFQPSGISLGPGLNGLEASVGPLAAADIDGDGTVEVFVGGHVAAGKYPFPVSSGIYSRRGPQFVEKQRLPSIGICNAATFADLNSDGWPELIIARDLGPIEIFANNAAVFTLATEKWGIDSLVGFWQSVAAVDLNNDGRLDLVAGNWGRNSRYERYLKRGFSVLYGDNDRNGITEFLEVSKVAENDWLPLRHYEILSGAIPSLGAKFGSNEKFVESTLASMIRAEDWQRIEVSMLESSIFINNGSNFIHKVLPIEAQFTPGFGIAAGDFNGDGNMDLFLAQNFFAVDRETSRFDAGRGLVMVGNGKGDLEPKSAAESGIAVYGEMRSAGFADYNRDGRWDLAIGQNAGELLLYEGKGGESGIRVKFEGPPGNPNGIGTQFRCDNGPLQIVSAGSGFFTQHAAYGIAPSGCRRVEVRWPGGKVSSIEVPRGAREILISHSDKK